jgi:DNA-binding beta-propeller fold protein YncE
VKTIGEPHPVAFIAHDDRGNVYVSGWDFPFVWQIDPRTVQIVRRFRVETRALGLAVGGGSLWVVDRLANAVTRIDLAQRRVAETIRVGVNPLASSFGYGALWVANGDSGTVSVFQPGAVKPLEVRDIPSPFAISTGAGGVWVASNGMHAVYRIDPDTHAIVKRIDLGTPYDFLYGVSAGEHGVWAVPEPSRRPSPQRRATSGSASETRRTTFRAAAPPRVHARCSKPPIAPFG